MRWRLASFSWPPLRTALDSPAGAATSILAVATVYLAIGLLAFAAWRFTGNDVWVEQYFRLPGAVALVLLAAAGLLFSMRVLHEFSPSLPMHTAWKLIGISFGCDLAGALFAQILGTPSGLNPLSHLAWWSGPVATSLREYGLVIGGTFRFAFLAAGLFYCVRVHRRAAFAARLAPVDWVALAVMGGYLFREAADLNLALRHGKHPGAAEILGWPTDPLLWLLLAQSMLLYRSARQMGPGWIGRCWKAFSLGVALVALGDMAIWATNYGVLPWPWRALEWYIWIPAAAAFAVAPVYQMEAIHRAYTSHGRSPLHYTE